MELPVVDISLSWTQPQGRWQSRGADLACLRLACGIAPGQLGDRVIDEQGHTLWHYWAHGPAPHALVSDMKPVAQKSYRNTLSHEGEHPLHLLAAAGKHQGLLVWTQLYGDEAWTTARNRHGDNLVASALWSGNDETAKWAISNSVGDMDNQDHAGLTCLMVAVHRCREPILEALLGAGADPGITDAQGRTPLHHAASRGLEDMFVLLEDAGCDPNEKDKTGATPNSILARAAKSGNPALLALHWEKRASARLDF